MKPPFPYFGGKTRVASHIWEALGDPELYVEPFAGSLSVLFDRPFRGNAEFRPEIVNDIDGHIANVWRSIANDPECVAHYCDSPVNETDVYARQRWLIDRQPGLVERLESNPDHCEPRLAAYWIHGVSATIGGAFDYGTVGANGLPYRKRPHVTDRHGIQALRAGDTLAYLQSLAKRLRYVRVCCGDWSRVVTVGALSGAKDGVAAVFFDPPYSPENRQPGIYQHDSPTLARDVAEWCREFGNNPGLRIVLAGYRDDPTAESLGWRRHEWSGRPVNQARNRPNNPNGTNRHRETLWFSPHCLEPQPALRFA